MAGFNPITAMLGSVTNLVGGAQADQRALRQAHAAYAQQAREIDAQNKQNRAKLQLEADQTESQRRTQLRRDMAKQQAAFGGMGIATNDGSGEAVLSGLLRESETDRDFETQQNALKRDALARDTALKNQRNLLSLQHSYQNAKDRTLRSAGKSLLGVFN